MTIQEIKEKNLLLFEVISGSRSFGLETPTSDTDIKGVFYLPKDKFFGLDYIPQVSNETNDIVYYEIGRFTELLLKNNPNILEILATPENCILYRSPLMDAFRLEDFLSKLCKDSFAGYAMTQIKKARGLNKKIVNPLPKEKKSLLDFCYIPSGQGSISLPAWLTANNLHQEQCGLINIPHIRGMYYLFTDVTGEMGYKGIIQKENSNEVSLSSIKKGEEAIAYLYANQDAYSTYCKEYTEYWKWIENRNQERFDTNIQHGKNYDSKNMMHTIRLLQSAVQILATGQLNIKVSNRDELLAIKAGKMEYDELLEMADSIITSIEKLYLTTFLPSVPDKKKIESLLIGLRSELYS